MLEILLSNIELKNKKLTFFLDFPCWNTGEIPIIQASRDQKLTSIGAGGGNQTHNLSLEG